MSSSPTACNDDAEEPLLCLKGGSHREWWVSPRGAFSPVFCRGWYGLRDQDSETLCLMLT